MRRRGSAFRAALINEPTSVAFCGSNVLGRVPQLRRLPQGVRVRRRCPFRGQGHRARPRSEASLRDRGQRLRG